MKNKKSELQFNNLNLTIEERKLISKINKNIKSLEEKTNDYFSKRDEISNFDTKSAFVIKYNDHLNLQEYKKIIDEFDSALDVLEYKTNEDIKIDEKRFPNLLKANNLNLIKNTLNNYNHFYLKTLKLEALNLLSKLQATEEEKNKEEIYKKYDDILVAIKNRITNKNMIHLNSIENDYKFLFELRHKKKQKYKLSTNWKLLLIFFAIVIVLFFFVGIFFPFN